MSKTRIAKSRIVEAACRTDFLSFFQWCFHVLEPGSTLNMNWHHYAMAYHLELVLRGVIKRLIIVAPPRTLKSLMCFGGVSGLRVRSQPGLARDRHQSRHRFANKV